MIGTNHTGASTVEPPEGVIAGESVPQESELDEIERQIIDEMVAILKTRPAYQGRSDDDLRDIAHEKLQERF